MRGPYRPHSVWLDVAGVVLLLTFLVASFAYLATEMAVPISGSGAIVGGGKMPPLTQRPGRTPARPSSGPRLLPRTTVGGSPGEIASRGEAVRAPFSDRWQAQAAPNLARNGGGAGAGPSSGRQGGADTGPTAGMGPTSMPQRPFPVPSSSSPPARDAHNLPGVDPGQGPALATRGVSSPDRSLPSSPPADRREENRSGRDEAKRLSGRLQALSGQLRKMDGSATTTSVETSDSGPGSPNSPDRRNPGSPSNVPIGDHLPWLAAVGILWGAWRIGRGA